MLALASRGKGVRAIDSVRPASPGARGLAAEKARMPWPRTVSRPWRQQKRRGSRKTSRAFLLVSHPRDPALHVSRRPRRGGRRDAVRLRHRRYQRGREPDHGAFRLSSTAEEIAVAAVLIGAVIGGMIGGGWLTGSAAGTRCWRWPSCTRGRDPHRLSPDLRLFIAFRIVTGIAVGCLLARRPHLHRGAAPAPIRGGLVILQQLAISCGILLSYVMDYAFDSAGWGWRPMFAAAVVPAVALASACCTCRIRRAGWRCRAAGTRPAGARAVSTRNTRTRS